ncbi:helix-turn-helix domain-containing protein [Actinopolymorpha pittospori]|uniref:helix-turn-helix domain-containing protein n=1 Tax=Actinopolymorpha pittospori TaxID=648752 RepID=UPI00178B0DD3
MEQRLDAVRAVLAGRKVTEVASRAGVHRASVHRWVGRYLAERIGGLADRSHRPTSCPHQAAEVGRSRPRRCGGRVRGGVSGGSGSGCCASRCVAGRSCRGALRADHRPEF